MCVLAASEIGQPKTLGLVERAVINAAHRKGIPATHILDVRVIRGHWKVWILNRGWQALAEIEGERT